MPELPDISLYLHGLGSRVIGHAAPSHFGSSVRSCFAQWTPPVSAIEGQVVVGLDRLGKRIVFELEGGYFLVIHLMIAGGFTGSSAARGCPARWAGRVRLRFGDGDLHRGATQKRASIHWFGGEALRARSRRASRSSRRRGRSSPSGCVAAPHPEASAHRSADLQRHRQRVLG